MTKRDLVITILEPLLAITKEKAIHLADIEHGEYVHLMKNKKSHLEEMAIMAENIMIGRRNNTLIN